MKDGAVYPDKDDSGVPGMTEIQIFMGYMREDIQEMRK